jgi:mannose-6-phosphate isomerase-like protein (cupin superfamily)
MKRVFTPPDFTRVPDGTLVAELLRVGDGFSMAPGVIEPGNFSKIHLHPFVTQATYVRSGRLIVWMRGPKDPKPYSLELESDQACLTEPGTLFQLVNPAYEPCHVLYIVSPSFLFETGPAGNVVYNDAVILEGSWEDLAKAKYDLGKLAKRIPIAEERQRSAERLARLRQPPNRHQDQG